MATLISSRTIGRRTVAGTSTSTPVMSYELIPIPILSG